MGRLVGIVASVCALGCGIPAQERYEVRGTIEAVDASQGVVDIAHEAIPGFMPAMTMSFDVTGPELLHGVVPGASVSFTLERSATVLLITALRVTAVPHGALPVGSGGRDLDPGRASRSPIKTERR